MIRWMFAAMLALLPAMAAAQAGPGWRQEGGRIHFDAPAISLPLAAAGLRFEEVREASRGGEGIDVTVQYVSPDREVFATVFLYLPGLSHPGLAAVATDSAIRMQGGIATAPIRSVAAAGREGVALRADYRAFRRDLASSAAFLKLDRWTIKLRVSGPERRKRAVASAMDALLAGLRLPAGSTPAPAVPLEIVECDPVQAGPARPLPGYQAMLGSALGAALDGAGVRAIDEGGNPLPRQQGRVGRRWCAPSALSVGGHSVTLLRSADGRSAESMLGRSLLVVLASDSGTWLELVEEPRGQSYSLLLHEIGSTTLTEVYDAPPSEAQLAETLRGFTPRATVRLKPNGDTEVQVPPPPPEA